MAEILSYSEIEQRYPSEWVLIGQPQTDEVHRVIGGTVVFHSKDRDEVDRHALTLPVPRYCAIRYTGPIPAPGTTIIL
jgi:hypothetical protein